MTPTNESSLSSSDGIPNRMSVKQPISYIYHNNPPKQIINNNNSGNCFNGVCTPTCYFKDNIPILPSQGILPNKYLFEDDEEQEDDDDVDEYEYDDEDISYYKASMNQDLLRIDQLILMN